VHALRHAVAPSISRSEGWLLLILEFTRITYALLASGSTDILINVLHIMKKTDIVNIVHEITQGTKVQAQQIVDAIFDSMTMALVKMDDVDIAGFGKFVAKKRPARTARNPRTGETVNVAATVAPKFRASKALKDAVAKK
jgi:DNA-binding protein HU-beta